MEILVQETRGGLLENQHPGKICVVDDTGTVVAKVGDVEELTYYRSASKPIQALPVLSFGLYEKYGLDEKELAIMAGSHAGFPVHVETLQAVLKKCGFQENDAIMLPAYPADESMYNEHMAKGLPPRKILHNCFGKHIAGMLLQRELTGNHVGYWQQGAAAQEETLTWIALLSNFPREKIFQGVDGCGVPVFALPLYNMACSYQRMGRPEILENAQQTAIHTLTTAINRCSDMMRGPGHLCTELNKDPNIMAKSGARGVYCLALKKEGLGIAIKFDDGTVDYWPYTVLSILQQLGYKNQDTLQRLQQLAKTTLYNDNKDIVGEITAVFHF